MLMDNFTRYVLPRVIILDDTIKSFTCRFMTHRLPVCCSNWTSSNYFRLRCLWRNVRSRLTAIFIVTERRKGGGSTWRSVGGELEATILRAFGRQSANFRFWCSFEFRRLNFVRFGVGLALVGSSSTCIRSLHADVGVSASCQSGKRDAGRRRGTSCGSCTLRRVANCSRRLSVLEVRTTAAILSIHTTTAVRQRFFCQLRPLQYSQPFTVTRK